MKTKASLGEEKISLNKNKSDNQIDEKYLKKVEAAKKHYERVIDAIQDGVCVIDCEHRIQSWNKVFAERVGFGLKKLKNKRCSDIMPRYENWLFKNHCTNRCCHLSCKARAVFGSGKHISYLEYNIDKEGKPRYHRFSEFPTTGVDGKVEQVVIIIRDVTEQLVAQENLQRLSQELEKKVFERTWQLDALNKKLNNVLRLKSEFISDASHELRTPLTVIQGNLDLAYSEAKRDSMSCPEALALIDREAKHMASILSDLTMLTNSDTGSENLKYEKVDLELLIFDVQQSLRVLSQNKGIKVIIRKNSYQELYIMGDEIKLERLLINIVRNAIKYTERGGKIEIWTKKTNKMASIHVKDDGIGIPQDEIFNIFERFYRVDKARSRAEGGTGLGLSICKSIAEAHQGSISVKSELYKGSEFIVDLPLDYKKAKNRIYPH